MFETSAKSCGIRKMLAFHLAVPFIKSMVSCDQVKENKLFYIIDENRNSAKEHWYLMAKTWKTDKLYKRCHLTNM
jgi:hypothetical protein